MRSWLNRTSWTDSERPGLILMAVLVLIAMLTLGAYSVSFLMSTEAWAVKNRGRMVQARMAAESAVEYVKAYLFDLKVNGELGTAPLDDPAIFDAITLSFDGSVDAETPYFVCLAPDETGTTVSGLRFGISDEAARVHLNVAVREWYSQQGDGEEADGAVAGPFEGLETLDPATADAILDWLDEDDLSRDEGAESDYYQMLNPPLVPRNGPVASVGELLLVRGVTPRVLFGEDADLDGVLDWNENDAASTYPNDDGDGYLDRGLYGFLTLYTREPNRDRFGEARIDLNQQDLEALYDQLVAEFGEDLARFVIAYRLFGPAGGGAPSEGGGTSQQSSPPEPSEATPEAPEDGDESGPQVPQELAGLDASGGPRFNIESVADLIDAEVDARLAERGADGQPRTERLESPLRSDNLEDLLPELLDRTTVRGDQTYFEGLINVNTAPIESLLAVPEMDRETAELILSARPAGAELGGTATQEGLTWLLTSGALTKEEFRQFERYLTARSYVYRVQAVGFFAESPIQWRVEAVVDVAGDVPTVRWWLELDRFGRGVDVRRLLETGGTVGP